MTRRGPGVLLGVQWCPFLVETTARHVYDPCACSLLPLALSDYLALVLLGLEMPLFALA